MITADQKYILHKARLHDRIVQLALAGFLVVHFEKMGVEIDREIFEEVIEAFAVAMSKPDLVERCAKLVEAMQEKREAESAERRRGMH